MTTVSPNWDTDRLLHWLEGRFVDKDEALRAIEHAGEAGSVIATARDNDEKRTPIDADEWVDARLAFSKVHGYWLLAPPGWKPLSKRDVIRGDMGLFAGGITASRGHSGDNAGRSVLVALLHGAGPRPGGPVARHTSPVFGCPLTNALELRRECAERVAEEGSR